MSTTKGRSRGAFVFSLVSVGSVLGITAFGGCSAGPAEEAVAEAGMAVCASLPDNDCMNWAQDGGQWCTTTSKAEGTACLIDGVPVSPGQCDGSGSCGSATSWEYGNFRGLPDGNPNDLTLGNFVAALTHGTSFTPSTRPAGTRSTPSSTP